MIWKLLIGGEGGVGKTAIVNRYMNNVFEIDTKMTIGVAFVFQDVQFGGNTARLQIWDLGGQDRFRFVLPSYCLGGNGAFIAYDTSNLETLEATGEWFKMIKGVDPLIPILLVGTKFDLLTTDEEANAVNEAAFAVATKHGCIGSVITSSKLGINVNEAMNAMIMHLFAINGVPCNGALS
jgi:small GTP-binding protein